MGLCDITTALTIRIQYVSGQWSEGDTCKCLGHQVKGQDHNEKMTGIVWHGNSSNVQPADIIFVTKVGQRKIPSDFRSKVKVTFAPLDVIKGADACKYFNTIYTVRPVLVVIHSLLTSVFRSPCKFLCIFNPFSEATFMFSLNSFVDCVLTNPPIFF